MSNPNTQSTTPDGWDTAPRPDVTSKEHQTYSKFPGLDADAMQGQDPKGHYSKIADKIHGTTPTTAVPTTMPPTTTKPKGAETTLPLPPEGY
jgi:hypothetical protein